MATAPLLSFVVTCKGRLAQLQATLPTLLQQPGSECIVVDYDCPQNTADWVKENQPAARVVAVHEAPVFRLAHARNLGAASTLGQWLCFIDADVWVKPGFAATLIPLLDERCYFRPQPLPLDASGTVVCRKADFMVLGGYDEVIEGWGGEDDDLYSRLQFLGRQSAAFPAELIGAISHDDSQRTAYYAVADRWRSQRINSFYLHVKFDLMRQLGVAAMNLEMRRHIYQEIRTTFLANPAPETSATYFEITLPIRHETPVQAGWRIERKWLYVMSPTTAS